jgi:hypothetical protein
MKGNANRRKGRYSSAVGGKPNQKPKGAKQSAFSVTEHINTFSGV